MGNVHEFYTMDKTERCALCMQYVSMTNGDGECLYCRRDRANKKTGGINYKLTSECVDSAISVCTNIFIVARDSNGDQFNSTHDSQLMYSTNSSTCQEFGPGLKLC